MSKPQIESQPTQQPDMHDMHDMLGRFARARSPLVVCHRIWRRPSNYLAAAAYEDAAAAQTAA